MGTLQKAPESAMKRHLAPGPGSSSRTRKSRRAIANVEGTSDASNRSGFQKAPSFSDMI
jgi:hypothetical protein